MVNDTEIIIGILERCIQNLKGAERASINGEIKIDEEFEKLADLCHVQWSSWMRYLFSKCVDDENGILIPDSWVKHWKRQLETPYTYLPEREKESDRKEAERILELLYKRVLHRNKNYCSLQ